MAQEVNPPSSHTEPFRPCRLLGWAFIFAVLAFAWFRFSDNTADNDLWGHVLFGQRNWNAGHIERIDRFSWTAAGAPWINHEVAAEIALGLIHRWTGSRGLWLFMLAMAVLTAAWASLAGGGRDPVQRWMTLVLFAASVNSIALGYAVRPQLFTMLAMVALLATLRRFFAGQSHFGFFLPPLFACWVNLHGGYLAGWLLLLVAGVLETVARLRLPRLGRTGNEKATGIPVIVLVAASSTLALALNPWGFHLVGWTIETLRLPRPNIAEWQSPLLSFGNAPFYLVLVVSLSAWIFSREPRRAWEAAVLLLFSLMAMRSQRHVPLFGLANLMLTPPHLADVARQIGPQCASLLAAFRRPLVQTAAVIALGAAGVACLGASLSWPRVHPFTIEVPRDTYPVAAIGFIRSHDLTGNTLTFFDWGEQVIWELPGNPVSFDGRLDTVYSPEIMNAHWCLYAGASPGPALDLARAAIALLPTGSGGVDYLRQAGWRLVYRDPLASVLIENPANFPTLAQSPLPVFAGIHAVQGREPFPAAPPLLGKAAAAR